MKKFIAILLSIIMLIPNVAFAASEELAAVTLSVKNRIEIPDELNKFKSNVQTDKEGNSTYSLIWTNKEDNNKQISITVNDKDDIISYSKWGLDNKEYPGIGISKFDKDYYIETAKAWIEKVNPSWVDELDFDTNVDLSSIYSSSISVHFNRVINGLNFCSNYVSFNINKYSGEITRVSSNWTYSDVIADINDVLDEEILKNAFGKYSGVRAVYKTKNDSKNAQIIYIPNKEELIIDALTGEENTSKIIDNHYREYGLMADSVTSKNESATLTKEETEEIDRMNNLISSQTAITTAQEIENTYTKEYEFEDIKYYKVKCEDDAKYEVKVSFESDKGNSRVTLDATTAKLLSLSSYNSTYYNDADKLSSEVLKESADEFKKKYAPDIAEKVNLFNENSDYYYNYLRSENDIEYADNYINIRVNLYTGKVTDFYYKWDDEVTFASADNIISNQEAFDFLCEKIGFDKYYFNTEDGVKIGYSLKSNTPYYIDAVSGKILDYNLDEYVEDEKIVTGIASDLDGHYAKEYIDKLMQCGIIKYEEKFRPDDKVTVKEALEFLNCLDDGYVPYDITKYPYSRMVSDIFGDEKYDENAIVTREQAAMFIVKERSNYDEIASLKIFDSGFNDRHTISDGYEGYIAILKGLGVINGDGMGNFNPLNEITRADFIILLYKSIDL